MTRTVIFVTISLVVLAFLAWAFQRRLIYFPMVRTCFRFHRPSMPSTRSPCEPLTDWTSAPGSSARQLQRRSPSSCSMATRETGTIACRSPSHFDGSARRCCSSTTAGSAGTRDRRATAGSSPTPLPRVNICTRGDVDPARIVYFGESFGAAVAAELAVVHPPAALILRSPFTTLAEVGGHHYPSLPVRWLLRDRFSTIDFVRHVRAPTLVIAGDRDDVVPADQSRRVFDAAAGPKELVIVPGADHNDEALFAGETMMSAIERLLRRYSDCLTRSATDERRGDQRGRERRPRRARTPTRAQSRPSPSASGHRPAP